MFLLIRPVPNRVDLGPAQRLLRCDASIQYYAGATLPANPNWEPVVNGATVVSGLVWFRTSFGLQGLRYGPVYDNALGSFGNGGGTPVTPPLDFTTIAGMYLDAATPYTGPDTAVATIMSQGTIGAVFGVIGATTIPISHNSEGFRFSASQYMNTAANPITVNAGDGFIIVAEFTPQQITGTQQVLTVATGSTQLATLRGSNAVAQLNVGAGLNGAAQNITVGSLQVGASVVMAAEFDRVAGTVRYWNEDAQEIISAPIAYNPITLNQINLGQGANVNLHAAMVITRGTGQAWPATFEEVLANFQ